MHKALLILLISSLFAINPLSAFASGAEPVNDTELFSSKLKQQMAEKAFLALYNEIDYGQAPGPDYGTFREALLGFLNIQKKEEQGLKNVLTLVDFNLPSDQKRLWVIDLDKRELLFHDFVAHGRNSGGLYAESFSNEQNSLSSSLGFYLTAEKYVGKYGLSLRLDGLEEGYNDQARERAVVLHGADYASQAVVDAQGRLGRSYGCPAVPFENKDAIVAAIAERSVLFINGPDQEYEKGSSLLDQDTAINFFASKGFDFSLPL